MTWSRWLHLDRADPSMTRRRKWIALAVALPLATIAAFGLWRYLNERAYIGVWWVEPKDPDQRYTEEYEFRFLGGVREWDVDMATGSSHREASERVWTWRVSGGRFQLARSMGLLDRIRYQEFLAWDHAITWEGP